MPLVFGAAPGGRKTRDLWWLAAPLLFPAAAALFLMAIAIQPVELGSMVVASEFQGGNEGSWGAHTMKYALSTAVEEFHGRKYQASGSLQGFWLELGYWDYVICWFRGRRVQ